MNYRSIHAALFINRPSRFIANVELNGKTEICHVKNTGRCKELFIPGAEIYLSEADNPKRVTRFDLVTVRKGERLINVDSQAPNAVFLEHLRTGRYINGITQIKSEVKHGGSRFDFYIEAGGRRIFIEVKGVTLEENGIALFPDAPTLRGIRHLNELAGCVLEGYEAHVVFVIQMSGTRFFAPNNSAHPAFGSALASAQASGVRVLAMDCVVETSGLDIKDHVPIKMYY